MSEHRHTIVDDDIQTYIQLYSVGQTVLYAVAIGEGGGFSVVVVICRSTYEPGGPAADPGGLRGLKTPLGHGGWS